ncbi:CAAX prenyl protease [Malassezia yamatoensis]|uniref:intramembrane prenyl-peptidase Rce1 n=1 Tax=Malassezia yamatoensis TaxID=253288 RepID=A0AAJ5YV74_9BASI|nr:CAAX prenyl protease [Malassezia yamatoensis]
MASISTVACIGYTAVYVGSLYVVPGAYRRCLSKKPVSKNRSRNNPQVVEERLWICMAQRQSGIDRIVCIPNSAAIPRALYTRHKRMLQRASGAERATGHTTIGHDPYLGTLYTDFVEESLPGQRNFRRPASRLQLVRNFVVAPISEELVFRSSMLATTQVTDSATPRRMIWTTPLYFGIAHLHHAYEVYCQLGKSTLAVKRAALSAGT